MSGIKYSFVPVTVDPSYLLSSVSETMLFGLFMVSLKFLKVSILVFWGRNAGTSSPVTSFSNYSMTKGRWTPSFGVWLFLHYRARLSSRLFSNFHWKWLKILPLYFSQAILQLEEKKSPCLKYVSKEEPISISENQRSCNCPAVVSCSTSCYIKEEIILLTFRMYWYLLDTQVVS